jgi:phytoene dehydrogenase-like protein
MPDAVVIGAGHNGLVAAAMLADAGWSVAVLEAHSGPGGAVRTEELTLPGFRHDTFSAFYPFAAASPAITALDLGAHGLRWRRSPLVLAHPTPDGRCVALSTDVEETAASLDSYAAGDGGSWTRLYRRWEELSRPLFDAFLGLFPPVLAGARLAAAIGPSEWARFARFALLPARRMAEEEFAGRGEGAALLLGGNAAHTDIGPESAGSGLFGWILACAGQQHGFPVPEGGAGELAAALCRRAEAAGATVACGAPVTEVVLRRGRAVAVRTADGTEVEARRAVLADVDAPTLFLDLVGADHLPPRVLDDLRRFEWDTATFKVDWALDGPVPWKADQAQRAATVHVSDSLDDLSHYFTQLATGAVPARPFLLFGQQAVADPSRCPPGTATGWAYTHVPRRIRSDAGGAGLTGAWDRSEAEAFADRIEARVEELAPGFRSLVRARHLLPPAALEAADTNLRGGAIGGGTQQLHQQLVFRPTPGLGRPTTCIAGLFLAGASAHPGAGVHGACGANAARAAMTSDRLRRAAMTPSDRLRRAAQVVERLRRTRSLPSSARTS